ncbi:hypothetical protein FQA39_LY13260 [Lamprigera yunnana]|nr:hypothetical protein FQA39_LY13260 [Lamprigera yunnana]
MNKFIFNDVCSVLDTYKGRDKLVRILCYSAKLLGSISNDKVFAKRCSTFSAQMSTTRAVLRLFDDLPMLKYSLQYGLGKEEPDKYLASIGVITNIVDQIYYPFDKIAWLADLDLITTTNNEKWNTLSSIFWAVSTYLNIVRSLRYLNLLQHHKNCLETDKYAMATLLASQNRELLTLFRMCLDFVHAVNTLPAGFLWSSKLQSWHIGLIGTTSSCIGLYQLFCKKS